MSHLQILRGFPSSEGMERTVRIWTPAAYAQEPRRNFPVLYMQDGQNVFSHHESALFDTWCTNRTMENLVSQGRLAPWLVVAVDSGPGRMQEYSPWDEPRSGVNARGDAYIRFLVRDLKPFIDRVFRTQPEADSTAVMGSSLGGLISLYAAWKHPDVFGRVGGLSPTVMWSHGRLFNVWKSRPRRPLRIYLDAGHSEAFTAAGVFLNYGEATRAFFTHLKKMGFPEHDLFLVLEPGGQHHERDWQRRLPLALRWLLA